MSKREKMGQEEFESLAAKAKEKLGVEIPPGFAPSGILPYGERLLREAIADCDSAGICWPALSEAHGSLAREAIAKSGGSFEPGEPFGWDSPEERVRSLSMAKAVAEAGVAAIGEALPHGSGAPQDMWPLADLSGSRANVPHVADGATGTDAVRGALDRIAKAMLQLPKEALGFGLDHLKLSLAYGFPALASPMGPGILSLATEAKLHISQAFADRPELTGSARSVMIESLSDSDKFLRQTDSPFRANQKRLAEKKKAKANRPS